MELLLKTLVCEILVLEIPVYKFCLRFLKYSVLMNLDMICVSLPVPLGKVLLILMC